MSKKRQAEFKRKTSLEDGIFLRTLAIRYSAGFVIDEHHHDWHQLIYASAGIMSVRTEQGEWVVPPNRAVWVPMGFPHSIEMSGSVFVQTIYIHPRKSWDISMRCIVVHVTPLLRELIIHVVSLGMLRQGHAGHARLAGLLLDQIRLEPTQPIQLPMPKDPRAKQAAEWMRAHPNKSLKQLANQVSLGLRTLERLFQKSTGMSLGQWRNQLRLLHALRLMASSSSVSQAADDVGYESPSAFIAAFKRFFGTTPGKFFQ